MSPRRAAGCVGHRVFRVAMSDRAKLDRALGDDVLSRQSITIRDARRFGSREEALLVFVEGEEAGLVRAEALLLRFAERAPEPDALLTKLRGEEEDAAGGIGMIFHDD